MENKFIKTQLTTITDKHGNYVQYEKSTDPSNFMMKDFKSYYPFPGLNYIEIINIYVKPEFRHKGIGSSLLQEVINDNLDSAIFTAIGASTIEYTEEPSDDEKYEITEKLKPFYEKNGFANINDRFGGYQFKCAYLYIKNCMGMLIYE